MGDQSKAMDTYEKVQSAFAVIETNSSADYYELLSCIFDGDDHWTNRSDCYFLEPEFPDMAEPINCLTAQAPVISSVAFTMSKEDFGDERLMGYVKGSLTKSRGHLLWVTYAMTWFFLKRFSLLPRCSYGRSREKVLDHFTSLPDDLPDASLIPRWLTYKNIKPFDQSPVVFCGALRPSELLNRCAGRRSVVVFPYYCMDWEESVQDPTYELAAYLIEFPNPIEPVRV